MSANRNKRYSYIAEELKKGQSNASIIMGCMATFPGCSEATARRELKEIIQRLTEIEIENFPEVKTRFMEIGWKILEDARQLGQMSAAVNQFKAMAQIAGVLTEKVQVDNTPTQAAPEASIVRERIALLMKSKKIRQEAEEAGLELEEEKKA